MHRIVCENLTALACVVAETERRNADALGRKA